MVSATASSAERPRSGAEEAWGSFNFKFYTYLRYLNQKALDDEYENAFGTDIAIDRRQDFQLQKAKIDTYGWVVDQRLTYLLYVWSANSSQRSLTDLRILIVAPPNKTSPEISTVGRLGSGFDGPRLSTPPKMHSAPWVLPISLKRSNPL